MRLMRATIARVESVHATASWLEKTAKMVRESFQNRFVCLYLVLSNNVQASCIQLSTNTLMR